MARIADFFGNPQPPVRRGQNIIGVQEEPTINQVQQPRQNIVEEPRVEPVGIRQPNTEEPPRRIAMVNRSQDADEVVHRMRQDNLLV